MYILSINISRFGITIFFCIMLSFSIGAIANEVKTFIPVTGIPSGKALIYFYKINKGPTWGPVANRRFLIGEKEATIGFSKYYPYFVSPGIVDILMLEKIYNTNILIPTKESYNRMFSLKVVAGETYYVRWDFGRPELVYLVSKQKGLKEINDCNLAERYDAEKEAKKRRQQEEEEANEEALY